MDKTQHTNAGQADPNRVVTMDPLRGRGLRFVLVDELMNHPSMTVAQMVTTIADHGYDVGGRASKVISDALRWKQRRGRVIRLARGVYAYHRAPATTARRIKRFAETCHRWIVAARRHEPPPPTPTDPRQPQDQPAIHDVEHLDTTNLSPTPTRTVTHTPPWTHLGWLWATYDDARHCRPALHRRSHRRRRSRRPDLFIESRSRGSPD